MELEKEIKASSFKSIYERLVVNILYTGSWLNALHLRKLKPYGISPQQYNILRILRGQHPNPATVNLIKERMLDKMSNTSRLVEKLRVKGLLRRTSCPSDRRAVDVLITGKGLEVLDELDEIMARWDVEFDSLTPKEAAQLNRLLDKMRG